MKYIFIDIDGTLVDDYGNIPSSTSLAIKQAKENGHKLFICSARINEEVFPYIKESGFTGMILGNSAQIYLEDNLVKESFFNEDIFLLIDDLINRNMSFYLETKDALIGNNNFKKNFSRTIDNIRNINEVFLNMIFNDDFYRKDIIKINYINDNKKNHDELKDKYKQYHFDYWGIGLKYDLFGDICQKNIHKGKGVKWIKDIYNLNDDDCIAIGDNDPDIMMFKECKDKIAMGNASDNCKKEATYITKDINEDGLYLAFKHLDLI